MRAVQFQGPADPPLGCVPGLSEVEFFFLLFFFFYPHLAIYSRLESRSGSILSVVPCLDDRTSVEV